jgi:hypothetical protein
MDAKRIAEIRESAAAVVALCGSRQSAFMSASEAIALCELAERGLAVNRAYMALRSIRYNANNGSQDRSLSDRLQLIARDADEGLANIESEILSNPKHERRG